MTDKKFLKDCFEDSKLISLTELGVKITIKLLLTVRCPHIFTICMLLKQSKAPMSAGSIFEQLYSNSIGNRMFFEYILDKSKELDLIDY